MSKEKKKGFWSWLGFGKKETETVTDTKTEQEIEAEAATKQITEEESTPAILDTKVEEQKNRKLEENITEVEEPETAEEAIEEVVEPETVEEIIEEVVEPEAVEEAVEEVVEPEAAEKAVEEVAEPEAVEEAVAEVVEPEAVEEAVEEVVEPEAEAVEEVIAEVAEPEAVEAEVAEEAEETVVEQEKPSRGGFFSRLVKGLIKTKQNFGSGFKNFFLGKKIDDDLFEELEEQLLIADVGVPTTTKIIDNLIDHADRKQLKDSELLYQQLKKELSDILTPVEQPLDIDGSGKKTYVILMVGVNGVGKTTTIGKLARQFQNEGKSVMLAAGDTFRAAAVEQLQVWGERNNIPVVAQKTGSDSASVIFDAMQSAKAKNIDVLIADTAGRLQNKDNLMNELKKIVRVMKKYDETAPHEIMLTLDAGTGQNAISQAKLFNEAVGLTGINLTKLDGSAKGGVIFAIADQFNLPIRYIGVGEKIEDLRPFKANEFIDALFVQED